MRLLAFDIETRPAVVATFSLFKPFIGIDQIIEDSRIFCFSYQWDGEDKVHFVSEWQQGRREMLAKMHALLDEADAVLTYNGNSFDIPWVTGELWTEGFMPPSPFDRIDLFQLVKSKTRFISKKLDFVADKILGERKVSHAGMPLWMGCMRGEKESLDKMEEYAIQDTALLLPLYYKAQGWFTTGHPNRGVIDEAERACPNCGSEKLQRRGLRHTRTGSYPRYHCQDCGAWPRSLARVSTTEMR